MLSQLVADDNVTASCGICQFAEARLQAGDESRLHKRICMDLPESGAGAARWAKVSHPTSHFNCRSPANLVPAVTPTAKALLALLGATAASQPPGAAAQQPAAMTRKAASPASPAEAFLVRGHRCTSSGCLSMFLCALQVATVLC